MMTNETFLASLKQLRERLGLSATDVANQLGVRFVTYMQWEKGDTVPNAANLAELRALLDPPAQG